MEPRTNGGGSADDATASGGGEGCDDGEQDSGRDVFDAWGLELELDVWDDDDSNNGEAGADAPENVGGEGRGGAVLESDHLDDAGEGDGDTGEAGGLEEVITEFMYNVVGMNDDAEGVKNQSEAE